MLEGLVRFIEELIDVFSFIEASRSIRLFTSCLNMQRHRTAISPTTTGQDRNSFRYSKTTSAMLPPF
ncbi:hypothetical protein BMR85_018155 [Achromobacter sp. KAs 3-5]|nr:hypothetical protein BMR85_018155 [Achromobacter sp. KAs 3-5]